MASKYAKEQLKYNTGPEQNIGPDMTRENKSYKTLVKDLISEGDSGFGKTESQIRKRFDKNQRLSDEAKAESQKPENTAPKYKAGGAVKSKASSRADGCAQRGKTKGRMV